jgi:DNA ligase (NAD+)
MNSNMIQQEQQELTEKLNRAAKAYYLYGTSVMSDYEYDRLYSRLESLEKQTGIVMGGSPTQFVGYKVIDKETQVTHKEPALSLSKTKDSVEIATFLGQHEGCLSWKMDGLTVVATYEQGKLKQLVTRGDGYVGTDCTQSAPYIIGLPYTLSEKIDCIVRGECYINYVDFENLNAVRKQNNEEPYANARNLAAGTLTLHNTQEVARRGLHFKLFQAVEGIAGSTYAEVFKKAKELGFDVVRYMIVTQADVVQQLKNMEQQVQKLAYPVDGAVIAYNDINYGKSLGVTGKYPRGAKAFKWADETVPTIVTEIEWTIGRTGVVTPVAHFKPIELCGTIVSKASLHNIAIMQNLRICVGDKVGVYKANMIIPQIGINYDYAKHPNYTVAVPAEILNNVEYYMQERLVQRISHFASKSGVNIVGLSEKTIRKLVSDGIIRGPYSLYKSSFDLYRHYGNTKSVQNLVSSIQESTNADGAHLLSAIGVPDVGINTAKEINKAVNGDLRRLLSLNVAQLQEIEGIGEKTARGIVAYFADAKNASELQALLTVFTHTGMQKFEQNKVNSTIAGKVFVITGTLHSYTNREALQAEIESKGGKVASSVSAKTDYLINNDINSNSGKNKKAKELGIPIITEQQYKQM